MRTSHQGFASHWSFLEFLTMSYEAITTPPPPRVLMPKSQAGTHACALAHVHQSFLLEF